MASSSADQTSDNAHVYTNHVRQANILSMRRYYAKNRDKELLRFKAYYQKNKDKIRAYKKRAREQTKDHLSSTVAEKNCPSRGGMLPTTCTNAMDIGYLCSNERRPQALDKAKMNVAFLLN
ncbi:hypothetical protein AaE_013087 [Aphanomyces astaci]|uniref:Uncharacterized protein n=1 Tax=Aphanomyces astaci TaxID=112090 RepID=A0A6A4Z5E4_APHAT|nr:hypothetical protein AaE_013087 [Aphanomyces astaci]